MAAASRTSSQDNRVRLGQQLENTYDEGREGAQDEQGHLATMQRPPDMPSQSLSPDSSLSTAQSKGSRFGLRKIRSRHQLRKENANEMATSHVQDVNSTERSQESPRDDLPYLSRDFLAPAAASVSSGRARPSTDSSAPQSPSDGRQDTIVSSSVGSWLTGMMPSSSPSTSQREDDAVSVQSRSPSVISFSPSKFRVNTPGRKRQQRQATSPGPSRTTDNPPSQVKQMSGFDRMFDKALQFFTDSDSAADKCPDDIWLLGVRHDGWRPEQEARDRSSPSKVPGLQKPAGKTRRRLSKSSLGTASTSSTPDVSQSYQEISVSNPASPPRSRPAAFFSALKSQSSQFPYLQSQQAAQAAGMLSRTAVSPPRIAGRSGSNASSTSSASMSRHSSARSSSSSAQHEGPVLPLHGQFENLTTSETYGWPVPFYVDFYNCLQLTYRSGFIPIQCSPAPPQSGVASAWNSVLNGLSASIGRGQAASRGDGLSSDAGWGCMLRTGQSLLANSLLRIHLGRDFRRPVVLQRDTSFTSHPAYGTYVRLLTWFLDDPAATAPFSIHRFAAEGEKLGKQVGEWFGPSTAAGAIKALANAYEPANLGVATAIDTTIYQSEVMGVALFGRASGRWSRPVLILVPLRLGINGVNQIYFKSLKHYFSLPQCVGIAGGRPSSSYYFVGSQADSLFYIDPHHTKPTVPVVHPPDNLRSAVESLSLTPTENDDSTQWKAVNAFFAAAYTPEELATFHCEKVRKMSLAGLDPSMLVGLLCRTQEEWDDLSTRMRTFTETCKMSKDKSAPIIQIMEEMPAWMRNPGRTFSSSTTNAMDLRRSSQEKELPVLPGEAGAHNEDSIEYVDSDDWDIDDSDEETSHVKSGETESDSPVEVLPNEESGVESTGEKLSNSERTEEASSNSVTSEAGAGSLLSSSPGQPVDQEMDAVVITPRTSNVHFQQQKHPARRHDSLEIEEKDAGWDGLTGNVAERTRLISTDSQDTEKALSRQASFM